MATATDTSGWTDVDRQYGYELGVDGYITIRGVSEKLEYSVGKVRQMLEAGSLRWFKDGDGPRGPVRICRRSVTEYAKDREM